MNEIEQKTTAENLTEILSKPVFNSILKRWVGEGKLDYEVYLRTADLLSLQTPENERVDPDELMFQIVHQAQEIWLKLLAHELAKTVGDLADNALWNVAARLDRVIRITRCLTDELRVLETLTPDTYQVIRRSLGNGSGQESPGYNTVQIAAAHVAAALNRLLVDRGISLVEVYGPEPTSTPELKRICELLIDFDEQYQIWLIAHFMVVRRAIGVSKTTKALDGVPSQVLVGRMTKPLFRELWKVREEMTARWNRAGGYAPGADRTATT
jgi:tryptophan 2,3-dioxygenase